MQQLSDIAQVRAWLDGVHRSPAAIEVEDLGPVHDRLATGRFPGCLFLGCDLPSALAGHLVSTGATVIGHFPERLFKAHRPGLYSAEELFAGFDPADADSHLRTLDHRIYEQYLDDGGPEPWNIAISLARRLHDHAITDAIGELVAGRSVVAIMGGHALERRDVRYRDIALIARTLTRAGYLLASGGGPGAMEATHLGAWFAGRGDDDLLDALSGPFVRRPAGATPGREYADVDWLHRAMALRERYPLAPDHAQRFPSLGVPTWLYGHEPPAPFATHIAKYFANSVREDGLLALAKHGVVFAPGSAGTIQEIFQDLTQNHYGTLGVISPMVLFGRDYWTQTKPVWQLVSSLAKGQAWGELLHLADTPEEVVNHLAAYRPLHHLAGTPDNQLEATLRRRLGLGGNVLLRHVAEAAAPTTRDLADDEAVGLAVARLVARGLRRTTPRREAPTLGALRRPERPGDALADWVCGFVGDDWTSPARAVEHAREVCARDGLEVLRLPEAPVEGWFDRPVVASGGLLVVVRGPKLSVWAGGLAD